MYREILATLGSREVAHLILHVTSKCNQACKTCFVEFKQYEDQQDLSLEEMSRIAAFYKKLIWLDISGGEPFLREDLPEILPLFKAMAISIPTNSFDPDYIAMQTLKISELSNSELTICVSIDGFEKTNDEMRKKGSFKKSLETIKNLKTIKNVRIKVNSVLCEKNYEEILPFISFVAGLGVNYHSIILHRGQTVEEEISCPTLDKLQKLRNNLFQKRKIYDYGMDRVSQKILHNYQKLMFDTSLRVIKNKKQYPSCLAYKYHNVIYPDGRISFCENRPSFGNIRNGSLGELLKSATADLERQEIIKKECYCYHPCNIMDNYFLNPKKYLSLLFGK